MVARGDILRDLAGAVAQPALPEQRGVGWQRRGVADRVGVLAVDIQRSGSGSGSGSGPGSGSGSGSGPGPGSGSGPGPGP
eukprot:COSAG04_NODE_5425_length_1624_cov_1.864262_1_plen_79_part_10